MTYILESLTILFRPSLVKIFSHPFEHSKGNWRAIFGMRLLIWASSLPSGATCRYAESKPNWWKKLISFRSSWSMLFKWLQSPSPKRWWISRGMRRRKDGSFQLTFVTKVARLARSPSKWSSSGFQSLSFPSISLSCKTFSLWLMGNTVITSSPSITLLIFSCKSLWSCSSVLVSFSLVKGVSSSSSLSGVQDIKVTMLFHDLAVPTLLSPKLFFNAERSIESSPMTLSNLEESGTHSVIEVSDSIPFRCFACNLKSPWKL